MPQPEGDDRSVDAMTQELHGGAVPQHMWRHRLGLQRRALLRSRVGMPGDELFDRVATERPPTDSGKHVVFLRAEIVAQPRRQDGGRFPPERGTAVLAPLAFAADVGAGAAADMGAPPAAERGA